VVHVDATDLVEVVEVRLQRVRDIAVEVGWPTPDRDPLCEPCHGDCRFSGTSRLAGQ